MSNLGDVISRAIGIGIGATVLFDGWLFVQQRLRQPTMNFALLGRWVGHVVRGQVLHESIAKAPLIRGERTLGWVTHYLIGIGFAALLLAVAGSEWIRTPTLGIALSVGIATAVAPLFILQPAMGAGFAASKTPTPLRNIVRSVLNHTVFGFAMYVAAMILTGLLD